MTISMPRARMILAVGCVLLLARGAGWADTAPPPPRQPGEQVLSPAPKHSTALVPDPNGLLPAGVSCGNNLGRCVAGTPRFKSSCLNDAACGRRTPLPGDCASGYCKVGPLCGLPCNSAAACGNPQPLPGDCSANRGTGTCGALVQKGQKFFLLSNAHVLDPHTVGTDSCFAKTARRGEPVAVASLSDESPTNPSRPVGTLFTALRGGNVDAAIAQVGICVAGTTRVGKPCTADGDCGGKPARAGDCAQRMQLTGNIQDLGGPPIAVNRSNAIDEAGTERLIRANPPVLLAKSGRTTGCTQGVPTAMNATIAVEGVVFKKQIIIRGIPGSIACSPPDPPRAFVAWAGDSGSLFVTRDQRIVDGAAVPYLMPVGLFHAFVPWRCVLGTPQPGKVCTTDNECGRVPQPLAGDCAQAELCGPDTPNVGLLCSGPGDCGRPVPQPGDCVTVGSVAIANPIREVLGRLGVSVVGSARPGSIPIVDR